jgi:hypothetical protein
MRERPILFSAPMVRAIVAGTKTQTRRVVKWREVVPGLNMGFSGLRVDSTPAGWVLESDTRNSREWRCEPTPCPYGKPGDRLWVRETWQIADWNDAGEPCIRYAADLAVRWPALPMESTDWAQDTWAALSDPDNVLIDGRAADRRWRSSIHMHRWASRITLEVTGVRVERLQDISEEDAIAEGIELVPGPEPYPMWMDYSKPGTRISCPIESYRTLWESINGPGSWSANPWVWAIDFRRL